MRHTLGGAVVPFCLKKRGLRFSVAAVLCSFGRWGRYLVLSKIYSRNTICPPSWFVRSYSVLEPIKYPSKNRRDNISQSELLLAVDSKSYAVTSRIGTRHSPNSLSSPFYEH